ncbi:MAG: glycosyltransferase family 4 protein [Chthoniobacterales bacterium]|nr:glycosyltransferase family 4 protein [Chthoniobacterales bacterium]
MKTHVFTNRVYPPVGGATGELLKDLAEGLAAEGNRVVVITSRGPDTLGLPHRETVNGVELIRVGSAPFTRASHWRRALSYALLYPQFAWQVWKLGNVDAVVSMTDPPLQVAAVTLASGRSRKRIHWAQDIYPELAEELGVIERAGFAARVLRAVSTRALRKQDEVVAVGRCMREKLIARGVNAGSIDVIPNWSPVGKPSDEAVAGMRKRMGWADKFIVLYSGNIGLAHDFATIVEAAKILRGGRVHIVFAGEGQRAEEVKAALSGIANVSFVPPQPKQDLAAFLAAADLHLVTVRESLAGLVVPSKIYGIMAAGRPVIYVGPEESEAGLLIAKCGAGLVFCNGNAAGVASALEELERDRPRVAEMGSIAEQAAGEFTFGKALGRWKEILG